MGSLRLPSPVLSAPVRAGGLDDDTLLSVLDDACAAVRQSLDGLDDWTAAGSRPGQYHLDLVADAAALAVLRGAGLGVLSEESGRSGSDQPYLAVLDPVDGSTNASRGLPYWSTSICVLDDEGPRVAVVRNQASGVRYAAVRGAGAERDGGAIRPSSCTELRRAIVGISGWPDERMPWAQFRAFGAASLELCAVADGSLDGYVVAGGASVRSWDYLGGWLMCRESGAPMAEVAGEDLVIRDDRPRRPVGAATPQLLDALLGVRSGGPRAGGR